MLFRKLSFLSLLLSSAPALAATVFANPSAKAPSMTVIKGVENIKVGGSSGGLSENIKIDPNAAITTTGAVSIRINNDNVINIDGGSQLTLKPQADGTLGIQLEKGRVEGVRRIELGSVGSTLVSTKAGSMEITGGRYEVKVGGDDGSRVEFKAFDGNATVKGSAAPGSTGTAIKSLLPGQQVTIANQKILSDPSPSRSLASTKSEAAVLSASFLPRVPEELIRMESLSAKPGPIAVPSFESPLTKPNPINRDPLQTPRNPNVTVKFTY